MRWAVGWAAVGGKPLSRVTSPSNPNFDDLQPSPRLSTTATFSKKSKQRVPRYNPPFHCPQSHSPSVRLLAVWHLTRFVLPQQMGNVDKIFSELLKTRETLAMTQTNVTHLDAENLAKAQKVCRAQTFSASLLTSDLIDFGTGVRNRST